MVRESHGAPSIVRAAIGNARESMSTANRPELRVGLAGLKPGDAAHVERLLAFARSGRYSLVHLDSTEQAVPQILRGELHALLVDPGTRPWPVLPEDGTFAAALGVPVLALVDDWWPGQEGMLLASGIVDVLEKEELDTERLDRAIVLAVARAGTARTRAGGAMPSVGDAWQDLRVLLARAVAAHARRSRSFALLRMDIGPPAPSVIDAERWQRLRSIVVQRLRSRLRRSDAVLEPETGRVAALIEDLSIGRDAVTVGCKIERVLLQPVRMGGDEVSPVLRLSWAVFPVDGTTAEELALVAEQGLAACGAPDAPQHFASSALASAYARARRLGPAFARALADHSIELALQPQTTLRPGPVGLAAVPRWRPDGEPALHHAELRELAELNGQLDDLTAVLLARAARQLARWHAEGLRQAQLAVPVVSRRQLARSDLPDLLRRVLDEAGVPAAALELELVPDHLGADLEAARRALSRIARTGVRLAMRIEAGGPPLALLPEIPLHTLKLSPALFAGAGTDHRRTAFLKAVAELARSLGLRVVAEDATTPERIQIAHDIGCDGVQAVMLSPPLPEPDARRWLQRAHRRSD